MKLLLGGKGLLKLRLPNSLLNLVLFSNVISKSDDPQLYARRLYLHKKWLSLSIIIFKSVLTLPCDCSGVVGSGSYASYMKIITLFIILWSLAKRAYLVNFFYKSHLIITFCVNNTAHTLMHFLKECYYSAFWYKWFSLFK